MKLADILGGKVVIHSDLLLVPCFKELYEKDPDYATNIISYIVFNNKWDSPYVLSLSKEDREPRLKEKFFGDSNYKLKPEEVICEKEF